MALKLSRGVMDLANLPKRVKMIAAFVVTVTALVALTTPGHAMFSKSAEKVAVVGSEGVKAVQESAQLAAGKTVAKTGKIVTCPRCRLNALPLVKKFVYTHAKLFEPNLKVDFIPGRDPVLHLYEDGKEVSEIDLAPMDWKQIIKKLVEFGIKPSEETEDTREALKTV